MGARGIPLLLLHVTAVTLMACSLAMPLPPEPKKEVLQELPSNLPLLKTERTVLLITLPEAEPPFDTTRMAYSRRPFELGYFNDYEWAAKPATMIQELLITALQNTHRFRQVISPPQFSAYDWVLDSRLLALTQDYTVTPPRFHAAMRVELVTRKEHEVIAARDLSADVPMAGTDPQAGVASANRAVAQLVRDAALFVVANARQD